MQAVPYLLEISIIAFDLGSVSFIVKFISFVEQQTGKCLVTLDDNQIPSYDLLDNVAYDYIKKPDIDNEAFDVLYFGTLALRNENNKLHCSWKD